MTQALLRSEYSTSGITHAADDVSDIDFYMATEADRRAHYRKSLRAILATLAVFSATLALLVALIVGAGAS